MSVDTEVFFVGKRRLANFNALFVVFLKQKKLLNFYCKSFPWKKMSSTCVSFFLSFESEGDAVLVVWWNDLAYFKPGYDFDNISHSLVNRCSMEVRALDYRGWDCGLETGAITLTITTLSITTNCDVTYKLNWQHQLRLITLLESSIILLESIYKTGSTYNCHLQCPFMVVKHL